MHKKLIAIVPAGGTGSRAAADGVPLPKQYRLLNGEPMLRWAVKALLVDPRIEQVRVAVAAEDKRAEAALSGLPRTLCRPCGGATRAQTVYQALLDAALGPDDWVMVHDAARPGLPADALGRLIDQCLGLERGGLLAQRVADTVKLAAEPESVPRTQESGDEDTVARVQVSVSRDRLWLAQTPQMFPAHALCEALAGALAASDEITDEASAMERAGQSPLLVPGSARNFKVTWPEDFGLMERWL